MTPKISVIIPVYNLSEYLNKCLWSVTNQTLKDIEIIVVNDGSQDNSLDIMERFASSDSRLKVINKANDGVVSARNSGLTIATGDYIHYLDGDDYIELDSYELLYNRLIDEGSDILVMKFWYQYSLDNLNESQTYPKKRYTNIEFLKHIWGSGNYFCLWQHIHKRSLYRNNILFNDQLSLAEDCYLTTQLAYFSKIISIFDFPPLYHYIMRDTSVANGSMSIKHIRDLQLFPLLIIDFMKDKSEYNELLPYMHNLEVYSENVLFMNNYTFNASTRSKRVLELYRLYPEIEELAIAYHIRKLIKLYSISTFLGNIYNRYYIYKGKIKNNIYE